VQYRFEIIIATNESITHKDEVEIESITHKDEVEIVKYLCNKYKNSAIELKRL